jgi:sodium-dependent dicarboxylate transporter 2/3/5
MIRFAARSQSYLSRASILFGPLLGLLSFWILSERDQQIVGFIAIWMVGWWITECVPLWIPALFPLAFPIVTELETIATLQSFFHPVLLLFIGGFLLSKATENSGFHLAIAGRIGKNRQSGSKVFLYYLLLTAFLSMWISNSAACLLMIPLVRVISGSDKKVLKAFALGIAYAASIGGLATLIGSPPNALFWAYSKEWGSQISFFQWMIQTGPFCLVSILVVWLYLGKIIFPSIWTAKFQLAGVTRPQLPRSMLGVYIVFLVGLALLSIGVFPIGENFWIFVVGVSLFLVRHQKQAVLKMTDLKTIPWSILLIFAGGISLSHGLEKTGITAQLALLLHGLDGLPVPLVLFSIVVIFIFFTEFASNTAVAAIGIPLAAPLAEVLHLQPQQLAQAILFASSLSFMLPVATPPNAIAYAHGGFSAREMASVGWVMNLVFAVWITAWVYFFPFGS